MTGADTDDRGGNGRNGDGTWPLTDGKGCPVCGAYGNGGHGGNCPNSMYVFDAAGKLTGHHFND